MKEAECGSECVCVRVCLEVEWPENRNDDPTAYCIGTYTLVVIEEDTASDQESPFISTATTSHVPSKVPK